MLNSKSIPRKETNVSLLCFQLHRNNMVEKIDAQKLMPCCCFQRSKPRDCHLEPHLPIPAQLHLRGVCCQRDCRHEGGRAKVRVGPADGRQSQGGEGVWQFILHDRRAGMVTFGHVYCSLLGKEEGGRATIKTSAFQNFMSDVQEALSWDCLYAT